MGVVKKYSLTMNQVIFTISLLLSRSLGSPLVPLVSLLQDPMEMMEAGAAMDMADMTAMAAGTPALMLLSTFLPGLAIGVLKGMMFSVLLDKIEKKPRHRPSHYYQPRYPAMQKSLPFVENQL